MLNRLLALPRVPILLLLLAGAVLLLPGQATAGGGCHLGAPSSSAMGSSVDMSNCFYPVVLHVSDGAEVTWTNNGSSTHSIIGTGWGDVAAHGPGEMVRYTFSAVGVFPYACHLHPGMVGAIIVGEAESATGDQQVSLAVETVTPDRDDGRRALWTPSTIAGMAIAVAGAGGAGLASARWRRK